MAEEAVNKMEELGTTGLDHSGGLIFEDFIQKLRGYSGYQNYLEMSENDGIVAGMLFGINQLMLSAGWNVDPAEEDPEAPENIESAEFIKEAFDDMDHSLDETLESALNMMRFGFSAHEIVYKNSETGGIGWKRFPIRSQDTILNAGTPWFLADNGDILGFNQLAPPNYNETFIPIEKALLFRTTAYKNNPEGKSVLRPGFKSYWYKKNIEKIENIGIERDLAGLPVMKVPPEYFNKDAPAHIKSSFEEFKNIVKNVRIDEQGGLVIPSKGDPDTKMPLFDFELVSSAGKKGTDTDKIINRHNLEMLTSILSDFILLGHGGTGSLALSEDKTKLFTIAVARWLKKLEDPFNDWAIPELMRLNGMTGAPPKLRFNEIKNIKLEQMAEVISKLSSAGMGLFPDPVFEKSLRKLFGLEEQSEEFVPPEPEGDE